jgi:hypothetical protein
MKQKSILDVSFSSDCHVAPTVDSSYILFIINNWFIISYEVVLDYLVIDLSTVNTFFYQFLGYSKNIISVDVIVNNTVSIPSQYQVDEHFSITTD